MFLKPATRSLEMETAHRNAAVQRAAVSFLSFPSDGMLNLLARSLFSNWDPRSYRSLVLNAGIPNDRLDTAFDLVEAVGVLGQMSDSDRSYCRGALLEKVTGGLLARRGLPVLEEQRVGPFPTHWDDGLSDPIDFVVEGRPEFYECKLNISRIKAKHLEQFRIISSIDAGSLVAFVTLTKRSTLVEFLADEEFRHIDIGPVFAFTMEDYLAMAVEAASAQVA